MEEKFNLNVQTANGEVIIRHGEANDVFQYHTDSDMKLVVLNHLLKA